MKALRALRRALLRDEGHSRRRSGPNRDFWVDDQHCDSCYECGAEFGLFNRKHHCRVCGRVFCGRCTSCRSLPNPFCSGVEPAMEALSGGFSSGTDERERVCHHCAQELSEQRPGPLISSSKMVTAGAAVGPGMSRSVSAEVVSEQQSVSRLLAPGLWPSNSWSSIPSPTAPISPAVTDSGANAADNATKPGQIASAGADGGGGSKMVPQERGTAAPRVITAEGPCGGVATAAGVGLGPPRSGSRERGGRAEGTPLPSPSATAAPTITAAPTSNTTSNTTNTNRINVNSNIPVSAPQRIATSPEPMERRPHNHNSGVQPLGMHSRSQSLHSVSESTSTASQEAVVGKNKDSKRRRVLSCPGGMRKLLADLNISWGVPSAMEGAMNAEELLSMCTVADMLAGRQVDGGEEEEGAEGGEGEPRGSPTSRHAAWARGVEVMQSAFGAVAKKHIDSITRQLLESEGFGADSPWHHIAQQLAAEAVASICPRAAAAHGESDICYYIKVKAIANVGKPAESHVIRGIVSRKNPARRDMMHGVDNPRILMLGGSLEYQRTQNRLVGLHTVAQQEREHLRNSVARVAQFQPDVVLVGGTVAQFALDAFQERNITVLLKCGRSLLAAVSRCTGAEVASSVEQITQRCVARCKAFRAINPYKRHNRQPMTRNSSAAARQPIAKRRVVSFFAPPPQPPPPVDPFLGRPPKGLVILEGCPQPLGCTIILKGAPLEELTRLKRVLQFLCYAVSHAARECSLLSHVALLTLPPVTAETDAARVLPLVDQTILATTRKAVQRMGALTEAARAGEPVLSVSPHVVPLHGRGHQAERLRYGPLPLAVPGGPPLEAAAPSDPPPALQLSRLGGVPGHLRSVSAVPSLSLCERKHGGGASSLGSFDMRDMTDFAGANHQRSSSQHTVASDPFWSQSGGGGGGGGGREGAAREPPPPAAPCLPPWASQHAMEECAEVLYAWQRLYLNVSSMHPDKALLCQVPEVKRLDFYSSTDIPLLKFVEAMDRGLPYSRSHTPKAKSLVPPEKCPTCGEAPQEHLYTLLHGVGRVTVAVKRLLPDAELPGGAGRLWLWTRPGAAVASPRRAPGNGSNGGGGGAKEARRAPLPPEGALLSLGQFLSVAFGGLHLSTPGGDPLLEGRVVYLACRRTIVAFHTERHKPAALLLPRVTLRYVGALQAEWRGRQVIEIAREAAHAFGMLQAPLERSTADEEETRLLLSEIRSDEAALMAAVREVGARCTVTPSPSDTSAPSTPTASHPPPTTDMAVVSAINNLRRDLAFKVLEWASLLQHPASAYIRTVSIRHTITASELEEAASMVGSGATTPLGSAAGAEEESRGSGAGSSSGGIAHRRSFSATTPSSSPARASLLGGGNGGGLGDTPELAPGGSPASQRRHRRAVSEGQALAGFDPDAAMAAEEEAAEGGDPSQLSTTDRMSDPTGAASSSATSPFVLIAANKSASLRRSRDRRPTFADVAEASDEEEEEKRAEGSGGNASRRHRLSMSRSWANMADAAEGEGGAEGARGVPIHRRSTVAPELRVSHPPTPTAPPKGESCAGSPFAAGGVSSPGAQPPPLPGGPSRHNSGRLRGQPSSLFLSGRCWMPPGEDDTVISIFDNEPTSVIAFVLQSNEYRAWVAEGRGRVRAAAQHRAATGRTASDPADPPPSAPSNGNGPLSWPNSPSHATGSGASLRQDAFPPAPPPSSAASQPSTAKTGEAEAAAEGGRTVGGVATYEAVPAPPLCAAAHSHARSHHSRSSSFVGAILGSVVGGGGGGGVSSGEDGRPVSTEAWHFEEDWRDLMSAEAWHYSAAFSDAVYESAPKAAFTVTAHFAVQFAALRARVVEGGEDAFVASLSRCAAWASQGGKSNAYFAKTRDDRFIVKQMSKIEKQSFLEFGPAYFRYLGDGMHSERPTCLAKILGVFEVSIKTTPSGSGGGKTGGGQAATKVIDVLVMENIFYGHSVSRIYDLKGSLRGRYNAAAADPSKSGEVMLDQNLLESLMDHPLCISAADSAELEAALWADTAFLARLGVMDYSLLVGADTVQSTLVVGVIDFIRQYTIDKQLETLLKSSGLLGGSGQQPTVVSPKQYMRRFRGAMSSYFTVMPDSDPQLPHLNPDS